MDFIKDAISPPRISILGFEVGQSVVVGWLIVLLVLILALLFRFVLFPRFRNVPKKPQSILELIVGATRSFTHTNLSKGAEWFSPYVLAVGTYIVMSGIVELFGFKPPTSDLSMTAALGLMSFFFINAYAFRYLGFIGRWRSMGAIAPVKIITDLAVPVSLSCRLYGNIMGGLIIMDLLYAVTYLVVPAVLSIYFTLFHTGMQTYIFLTLTLSFMNEPLEWKPKLKHKKRKGKQANPQPLPPQSPQDQN